MDVKEIQPINLVDCLYKPIKKVLARKMVKRLGKVIKECQHTFIKGRQIMDAALVANEVVDDLLSTKRDGMLCKLDIEKSYDHVIDDLLILCKRK